MKTSNFVYFYLIVFVFVKVESITNYSADKNELTEEDRRAAEPFISNPTTMPPTRENYLAETKPRGLFLSTVHRNPASLIHPAVAVGYNTKDKDSATGRFSFFDHHGASQGYGGDGKQYYPSTGHDVGFPGHSHGGYYPTEYTGGYGHTGSGYGHTGVGVEYPVEGYGNSGVGGWLKKSLGVKSLLIPLAGIALLGAAAVLTSQPVLLQLGSIKGRRRRRGLVILKGDAYPTNPFLKPDKDKTEELL